MKNFLHLTETTQTTQESIKYLHRPINKNGKEKCIDITSKKLTKPHSRRFGDYNERQNLKRDTKFLLDSSTKQRH